MINVLAYANSQLDQISYKETVKIAGITRRLKNWLRTKIDPTYESALKKLRSDTSESKKLLSELNISLNKIQSAIQDGDISDYEINYTHLKDLIKQLIDLSQEIKEDAKRTYTKEEMSTPEFKEKFQQALPQEYGIEFHKEHRLPLKSFEWYKNIDPSIIFINPSGQEVKFLDKIKQICVERGLSTKEEIEKIISDNKDKILANFKQAIANGNLLKAEPTSPSKSIQNVPLGRVTLLISTEPFEITGLNRMFQANVILMDLTVGLAPINKISLKAITHLSPIGDKIAQLFSILKKAEQIPYKITTLNDFELANVLRKGYTKAFGKDPTVQALAGGWAQTILESGRPVKLPNNNIGNIKAEDAWIKSGQPYFSKETGEFTSKGQFYKTPANWKAFASPEEGAAFYWKYLQRKHPKALEWMAAQDPTSATIALGLKGYFTANIKKYAKGTNSLYNEFMDKIAPKMEGLKNAAIIPTSPKPELKEWQDSYSKEEKENILHAVPNVEQKPANQNDITGLFQDLVAKNKLTEKVKIALIKQNLPETITVSRIFGNEQDKNFIFAKTASYYLSKYFDSIIKINKNNNFCDIESITIGTPLKVTAAIQNICDLLNEKFNNQFMIITAPNVKFEE